MPTCGNCGAFVSERFARVLGDNRHDVDGCLECCDRTDARDSTLAANPGGRP